MREWARWDPEVASQVRASDRSVFRRGPRARSSTPASPRARPACRARAAFAAGIGFIHLAERALARGRSRARALPRDHDPPEPPAFARGRGVRRPVLFGYCRRRWPATRSSAAPTASDTPRQAAFKDTYGGLEGMVFLECYQLLPRDVPSDTVLIFSHPVGGGAYLPMVTELARCGNHVIYANSRYRGNDSALIMEKVVLDLAAAVRHARERLGYERIVLGGWSGGGALSLFYQQQAVKPSVARDARRRPARPRRRGADPRRRDAPAGCASEPPPGALRLHRPRDPRRGRARASATPSSTSTTPPNPNQPPYSQDFLERYGAAQAARVRQHHRGRAGTPARALRGAGPARRRARVRRARDARRSAGARPERSTPTTASPGSRSSATRAWSTTARWASPASARLRSWLSQWSIDDANADGVRAGADVTVPALVVSQQRRQHLHAELRAGALRRARQRGQDGAHDRGRQPLLHRPRPARAPAALGSRVHGVARRARAGAGAPRAHA